MRKSDTAAASAARARSPAFDAVAATMVSAERQRELRRAKAPAFPRPKGRAPDGCTWNKQTGGWFKDDGSVVLSVS